MSISSGDFRVYMRQLAGWVWNEQAAAHSFKLSLQEETITEILLLEMARTLSPLGLQVRMFSKRQEGGVTKKTETSLPDGSIVVVEKVVVPAEGADWEWFVNGIGGCMASFRVQAKKLYRDIPEDSGRYRGFKPSGKQIQDLIVRASAVNSNPIYVFYNHPNILDNNLFGASRQPDYFGRDCWGCSVTTAQFMKHATSNKMSAIQPGTVPWHRFFGIGAPCRPAKIMKEIGKLLPSDTEEEPQGFVEAKEVPDWVGMLMDGQVDLNGYLNEHRLQGVAYFDFTPLREE